MYLIIKKKLSQTIAAALLCSGLQIAAHGAASLNTDTGVLFVPVVNIDNGAAAFAVTLQLKPGALPKVGDEISLQGATPDAVLGLNYSIFSSAQNQAY